MFYLDLGIGSEKRKIKFFGFSLMWDFFFPSRKKMPICRNVTQLWFLFKNEGNNLHTQNMPRKTHYPRIADIT